MGIGEAEVLPIGKGRVVREGAQVAIVSFGARLGECLLAADDLAVRGIKPSVIDARFAKPLDEALLRGFGKDPPRDYNDRRGCDWRVWLACYAIFIGCGCAG